MATTQIPSAKKKKNPNQEGLCRKGPKPKLLVEDYMFLISLWGIKREAEHVLQGPVAGALMNTHYGFNEAEWMSYEANL